MSDLDSVISVSLLPEGQSVARDNMNVVMLLTQDAKGPLNSNNRYALYKNAADVANDWGTASAVTGFANTVFSTIPNPVHAEGVLVVGYHRAAQETVPATAAILTGAQLEEDALIAALQGISDGSFELDAGGVGGAEVITGLDFRTVTSLGDVVKLINEELTDATAALAGNRIVITNNSTGASSELSYLTANVAGTFVGELLGLAEGTGATLVQGEAEDTLEAEDPDTALAVLKSLINFKGLTIINKPSDLNRKKIAEWAQANQVIWYEVFDEPGNLEISTSNIVWDIKLSGLKNTRCLYSKAGNRKLAASYMARAHTVNFAAENSALTMHLKDLAVAAETYNDTEKAKAKAVGLDLYTIFKKSVTGVLTSEANDFVDNVYNLMAFVDSVQTDAFNVLKTVGTKIAQTTNGVNALVDQCEQTSRQFVRAGVFAPGTWSSPTTFGNREVFLRNIEANGFYWLAGSLADQAKADRDQRKSPVLQCAVKNAGAIHSANIIINFNL